MRKASVVAIACLVLAGCAAAPAPPPPAVPVASEPVPTVTTLPVDVVIPLESSRLCLVIVCMISGGAEAQAITLGTNATRISGNLTLTMESMLPPQTGVSWWVSCDSGWNCSRNLGSDNGVPPLHIAFDDVPDVGSVLYTAGSLEGPGASATYFLRSQARVTGTLTLTA